MDIFSLGIKEDKIEKITKIPPNTSIVKIKGNQLEEKRLKRKKSNKVKMDNFIEKFKGFSNLYKDKKRKIEKNKIK